MNERDDHKVTDNRWSNPRQREKHKRAEEKAKAGTVGGHHTHDDEPWPEPAPPDGFRLP